MALVVASTAVKTREDLATLCNRRGVRIAIEVGTDLGVYAAAFMKQFEGFELYCIDQYGPYEWMTGDRTPDLLMAVQALQPYHGRVRILKMESVQAARTLPNYIKDILDFVYIDASHDYTSVAQDIAAWWKVLQPKGILAGHDYLREDFPGVCQAVEEHAHRFNLTVFHTTKDTIPSWYVFKEES